MKKPTIITNFTIGFGNNLFQYAYSKLLAEKNAFNHAHTAIPELNIAESEVEIDTTLPTYLVNDTNCLAAFKDELPKANFFINGYFEDYRIYEPHLQEIKSWFPKVQQTNSKDLIVHFRLQNRLIQLSHIKNHVTAEAYKQVFEKFEYDRLHIVTDAKKWDYYTFDDIEEIREEVRSGPNPPERSPWVPADTSLKYMNSLIAGFEDLDPIVHCNGADVISGSGALRNDFIDDFNLLRSFEKMVLFNSTFSWWAATLGNAKEVAAFGPWKPSKGKNAKNLGKTTFPGWFSWGSIDDLYWKDRA